MRSQPFFRLRGRIPSSVQLGSLRWETCIDANATSEKIKTTTDVRRVGLGGMEPTVMRLIVPQITKTAESAEVCAGAASLAWAATGSMPSIAPTARELMMLLSTLVSVVITSRDDGETYRNDT